MQYVADDAFILLVFEIKRLKSWLLRFLLPSWKRHPADCYVTLGGVVKMATAGRRVSESESSEEISSSSSNDSLLTDAGHLSLQPYMHEPSATPSTYQRKVDKSASQHTMGLAIVDSLNMQWLSRWTAPTLACDFPLCPHIVSDVS